MLLSLSLLIVCQLANHAEQHLVETLHLSLALSVVGCGSALLDAEGITKFLHQGGCEVCTPIAQQLHRHPKNCYEALVKHLHDSPGSLVLRHHHEGIPHEMVRHHEDVLHHRGLVQLHRRLYAGVV